MPLTTNWILARGAQYFGDEDDRHADRDRHGAYHVRRACGGHAQGRGSPRRARSRARYARGHVRVEHGAAPAAVLRDPGHRADHAHRQPALLRPSSSIYTANHAEDEAVLRRPLAAAAVRQVPAEPDDRQARRRDGRRGERRDARRPAHAPVGRTWSAAPTRSTSADRVTDERQAAAMCYTTGTTGNPKGVLYSHRSTWLHSIASMTSAVFSHQRARHDPAGRTDVPRQRVGAALHRRARRRSHRDARPGPVPAEHRVAARVGEGDDHRGRAHDLDGHGAAARRTATCPTCKRSSAAARPCRRRCPRHGAPRSACRSRRRGA